MVNKIRQYSFIMVLVITGTLIISAFAYSTKIAHDVADIHAPLVDAAMEIKFELALAHLQFEEHIIGDRFSSIDGVIGHLEQAKWYASAMLSGGQNSEGIYIPLEDHELRKGIISVIEGLTQFHTLIQTRLSTSKSVQADSDVDYQIDALFEETLEKADTVENVLLSILVKKRTLQRKIDYSIFTFLTVLSVIVLIYFINSRRVELALIRQLNEMAMYDELTGIPNRRSFNATLSNEWDHALRAQYPLSLVICDIDCFKQYNDTLGHLAGDECLKAVAGVLQSVLQRPVDSIARYGGDEFTFILPFTDAAGARKMVDTLHSKLSIKKIPHPDSDLSDYVTLSAGVTSLIPGVEHSAIELISVADDALYRAKQEGRNRACFGVFS